MVHLLFIDGSTRDVQNAVRVTNDGVGVCSCRDTRGRVIVAYSRHQLVAHSSSPFPTDQVEALKNSLIELPFSWTGLVTEVDGVRTVNLSPNDSPPSARSIPL
jgi:hypothetical protein